jgi:hypothetical protein
MFATYIRDVSVVVVGVVVGAIVIAQIKSEVTRQDRLLAQKKDVIDEDLKATAQSARSLMHDMDKHSYPDKDIDTILTDLEFRRIIYKNV